VLLTAGFKLFRNFFALNRWVLDFQQLLAFNHWKIIFPKKLFSFNHWFSPFLLSIAGSKIFQQLFCFQLLVLTF